MVTLAMTETMWSESRIHDLETRLQTVEMRAMEHIQALTLRLVHLERLVQYPNAHAMPHTEIKSQAAQQQATEHLYAPLRSDTRAVIDLAAFARRLIDMQDLGHAVTEEVRELAKRALGLK